MNKYLAYEVNELQRLKDLPIIASIVDNSGTLIATTRYNAKLTGIDNPEQLIGVNFAALSTEQIKWLMPDITEVEIPLIHSGLAAQKRLLDILIQEKMPLSYINFMPYGGIRKPFLETAFPILDEDLKVVGTKIVVTESSFYGQNEYFKELFRISSFHNKKSEHDEHPRKPMRPLEIRLADRQQEIVYLLSNGFAQSEVAQILNISRGSVANIVSEQICPKFNIAGSSTKILIEKAIELGLNKTMPSSLYKPFVIILNTDIVQRYF